MVIAGIDKAGIDKAGIDKAGRGLVWLGADNW
jgi:hypothetical protein